MGPKRLLEEVRKQAPEWAGQMPKIPNLIFSALTQISHQEERMQTQTAAILELSKEVKKTRRGLPFRLLGLVSLGAAWLTISPDSLKHLQSADILSISLFLIGLYLLILKP